MRSLIWLKPDSIEFPDVSYALHNPNGLLAVGGDLSPERLLQAYRSGIFPWYEDGQPILWWSPDPRSVLFFENLHISKSLRKTLRKNIFKVTFNTCFDQVIHECSQRREKAEGTWISDAIKTAYQELHKQGIAHSVEVWSENRLVGGLYGVEVGKVFCGESMFSRESDASKVALVFLAEYLQNRGFDMIDCQVHNPYLASMGAVELPRTEFLQRLTKAI